MARGLQIRQLLMLLLFGTKRTHLQPGIALLVVTDRALCALQCILTAVYAVSAPEHYAETTLAEFLDLPKLGTASKNGAATHVTAAMGMQRKHMDGVATWHSCLQLLVPLSAYCLLLRNSWLLLT
eukprot:GHUV01037997.1.p1 GENE.GHUV01037997.1~~GHUV01037997.1.p1  ORF type:complete len:125 (-),score=13.87 GHUV01037997.1:77-451(-)